MCHASERIQGRSREQGDSLCSPTMEETARLRDTKPPTPTPSSSSSRDPFLSAVRKREPERKGAGGEGCGDAARTMFSH